VAKSTAGGRIREIIMGIEYRENDAICRTEALLLRNILTLLKKSTIR
jgi:hypothetical protein